MHTKNDDIASLVAGDLEAGVVATRHEVSLEQVAQWKEVFLAGRRASMAGRRMLLRRRRLFKLAGVGVAALALLVSRAAFSACAQKLPTGMVTLCPSMPAVGDDLNRNFLFILDGLKAKIGAVDSPDATIRGKLSAAGGKPVLLDMQFCRSTAQGSTCCGASSVSKQVDSFGGIFACLTYSS